MKRCVIMDIDGCLANGEHRIHLLPANGGSWETFLAAAADDTTHPEIVLLNNLLCEALPVFIVTGRGQEQEAMTVDWLARHAISYDKLYMRPRGDRRPDTTIKQEILGEVRAAGFEPLFAIEDRATVTAMWRENGVRCLQVCEGNY